MVRDKASDVERALGEMRNRDYWNRKRRAHRLLGVFLLIGFFVMLTLLFWLPTAHGAEREDYQRISNYVEWFHRNVKPERKEKASEIIPYVILESKKYNIDPLLVACLISLESSWRSRSGALNEVGLMQIMPNKWARQFDLTTEKGQIEAGVYRLNLALTKCKSLESALTHYASGRCQSKSLVTQRKMKYRKSYYVAMSRKFKNGKSPTKTSD
jgi:hypothetical protein